MKTTCIENRIINCKENSSKINLKIYKFIERRKREMYSRENRKQGKKARQQRLMYIRWQHQNKSVKQLNRKRKMLNNTSSTCIFHVAMHYLNNTRPSSCSIVAATAAAINDLHRYAEDDYNWR